MVRYKKGEVPHAPFLSADSRYFRIFFEPDNGATANGAASTGQPAAGETSQTPPVASNPYDNIKWDEIPAETRTILETARRDHERVAGENATLQQQLQAQRQAQAQAQSQAQPPATSAAATSEDPVLSHVRATLKKNGFTEQQIAAQAPVFNEMLGGLIPVIRQQIGQDLGPLANTVIGQQNQNHFEQASHTPDGQQLFANPEIAQEVWNTVQQQTAAGRIFSDEAVLNFAKMVYFDKMKQTSTTQSQPQPTSSVFFPQATAPMNRSTNGGFTYPGASMARPLVQNGNSQAQGVHAVNEDTRAALSATFAELARTTGGVAPKAFPVSLGRKS